MGILSLCEAGNYTNSGTTFQDEWFASCCTLQFFTHVGKDSHVDK